MAPQQESTRLLPSWGPSSSSSSSKKAPYYTSGIPPSIFSDEQTYQHQQQNHLHQQQQSPEWKLVNGTDRYYYDKHSDGTSKEEKKKLRRSCCMPKTNRRPFYGIDAPDVIGKIFCLASSTTASGILFIALVPFLSWNGLPIRPNYPGVENTFRAIGITLTTVGGVMLLQITLMILSSLFGKFQERKTFLNHYVGRMEGNEQVLDIGCGRGFLMNEIAKKLDAGGTCHGIDIFDSDAQSGNSLEATLETSELEGVRDRVSPKYGDACKIPHQDNTFDLVVSSLVFHRLLDQQEAVSEMLRVLKPGGRVACINLFFSALKLQKLLKQCGCVDVSTSAPHFWIFPFVGITTATKPSLSGAGGHYYV